MFQSLEKGNAFLICGICNICLLVKTFYDIAIMQDIPLLNQNGSDTLSALLLSLCLPMLVEIAFNYI